MKLLLQCCGVAIYNPQVVYGHWIVTGYQASKLVFVVSTWDTKSSNDLSAYRNCTRQRQPLCNAYSDD